MKRRRFLRILNTSILIFVSADSFAGMKSQLLTGRYHESAALSDLVLIGYWYLNQVEYEANREDLLSNLEDTVVQLMNNDLEVNDLFGLQPVQVAIKKDFANGDVFSIGGWVLSKTECRLCGLISLGV